MSYPARGHGISLNGMQHLPALSRETPKHIDLRPFISRLVARWILSVLVATWPKGAGTDPLLVRGTHNLGRDPR